MPTDRFPGLFPVGRLDMDTTGAIIACKNDLAHASIAAQLKEHTITRRYEAIVCGVLKDDTGTIDAPIGRSQKDRKKMAVLASGGRDGRVYCTPHGSRGRDAVL